MDSLVPDRHAHFAVFFRKIHRQYLGKCPLLAQSRHELVYCTCPLSGVKQTWRPTALSASQESLTRFN
jgi:hypothetical protein